MRLEHLAFWVTDLETMKDFYVRYFNMSCGERYHNPAKQFSSYFLSFPSGSARIELMHRPDIQEPIVTKGNSKGLTHIAIATGSKDAVDHLTERLRADHYTIQSEPRTTGDGYYESVVLDPEGNPIEITI